MRKTSFYQLFDLCMIISGLFMLSCNDSGGFNHAGFSVAWSIEMPDHTPLDCDTVRAYQMKIELKDSDGNRHIYDAPCNDYFFESPDWDAVTGKASVTAYLNTESESEVAASTPYTFNLVSGALRNKLPNIVFQVPYEQFADNGPTVALSWEIYDGSGDIAQCDAIGVRYMQISIADKEGMPIDFGTLPCERRGERLSMPLPLLTRGDALLTIDFLSPAMTRVTTNEIPVFLGSDETISIGPLQLYAPPLYPSGDTQIHWTWTEDHASLTEDQCVTLGIDQVQLAVWNENTRLFWNDRNWMTAPCPSTPHSVDSTLISDDTFSGLYLDGMLQSGDYTLSLGFYRKVQVAGGIEVPQLVYLERAGTPSSPISVDSDELNTFETDITALKEGPYSPDVTLTFETDDSTFDACNTIDAAQMAFYLAGDEGLAMDIGLDKEIACRDTFHFSNLPAFKHGYTFTVVGFNPEGTVKWYSDCSLTPEMLEKKTDITCEIQQYTPTPISEPEHNTE